MKKYTLYIICLLLAVAVTSCKKEKEDSFLKGQMTEFHGQKAYIDGLNYSCFLIDDQIQVNGQTCRVSGVSSGNHICTISGAQESGSGYYAFYPAGMINNVSLSGGFSNVTVTLPRVQTYREKNNNQIIDNPMAGYLAPSSETTTIQFNNLCALLKVTVASNWTLDSIQVKLNGAELWGKCTVDVTNWKLDLNNGEHDTKYETVSLVFPNGMNLSSSLPNGKTFYIVVPQTTIFTDANKNDVIVQIFGRYKTATVSKSYSKELTADQSVAYNTINTLPTITRMEVGVGVFTVVPAQNGQPARKVTFAPGNLVEHLKVNPHRWHFPGKPYHGISTTNYNYYFDYTDDLIGTNASHDWGWVNTVNDNPPHTWRTPTKSEMVYVLTGSRGASRNCWYCKVNTINGLIIYPDGCKLTTPSSHTDNIDETVWANTYESVGCIFLPAHHNANYNASNVTQASGGGNEGFYAMANAYSTDGGSTGYKCFRFTATGSHVGTTTSGLSCDFARPSCGVNVRLVHDLPQ